MVVDIQGFLLAVKVLPADLHDPPAAELVLAGLRQLFPGVRLLWADTAYREPLIIGHPLLRALEPFAVDDGRHGRDRDPLGRVGHSPAVPEFQPKTGMRKGG